MLVRLPVGADVDFTSSRVTYCSPYSGHGCFAIAVFLLFWLWLSPSTLLPGDTLAPAFLHLRQALVLNLTNPS